MNQEKICRVLEALVIVTAGASVLFGTTGESVGNTSDSRLATVIALADHGTWYIDRPSEEAPIPFEARTIDKVEVETEVGERRLISSKPPVLSLLMTGEYVLLRRAFGWHLEDEAGARKVVAFMSLTFVGAALVLTLVFFARTTRLFVEPPLSRLVCLVSLAFCTQLWGYSTGITNHVPATCLLMISLYVGFGLATRRLAPAPWRFFLFGLTAALVPMIDMPAGVFSLAAGLYLLCKSPRDKFLWAIAGAAIPIALHTAIMVSVAGSPLPVQLRPDLYLFEASYWRNPRGIDALNESRLTYLFHMTFGRSGLFSLYPITFLGLVTSFAALRNKKFPCRPHILAGALTFLILTAYYAYSTDNYGGESYGFRWYIVATPVLLLMAAPVFSTFRYRWQWILTGLMMGVSFYSALECKTHPWVANAEWMCRLLGPTY